MNLPQPTRQRRALCLYALLCAAAVSAGGAAAATATREVLLSKTAHGVSFSRYSELARRMQSGTAGDKLEFAVTAIGIVIESYLEEIDKAAREPTEDAQQHRQRRAWRWGTMAYVEDLRRIAATLDARSSIDVMIERDGVVRIVTGGRQVMVNGPRPAEQDRLEARIAQAMCDLTRCRTDTLTVEEKVDVDTGRLDRGWVFAGNAPPTYAASDGLNCVFHDRKHIKLKQTACESFLRELRLLAEGLKAVGLRGFPVHWDSLSIEGTGPRRPHRVTYDRRGRFFHLRLSALYKSRDLWHQAIPWIKSYTRGGSRPHYIELPDDMVYVAQAP